MQGSRDIWKKLGPDMNYNRQIKRPQLFAALDAAAILWNAKAFFNPADANRPAHDDLGNQDDVHYWSRTWIESFLHSREVSRRDNHTWEADVKRSPINAFPVNRSARCARTPSPSCSRSSPRTTRCAI